MIEKIFGNVKGIFNTITIIELIIAIFSLILGVVFYSVPRLSNIVVSVIAGILFIASGVTSILSYFKKGDINLYNNNLIYGVLLIIAGILAMIFGKVLAFILGTYYIISGVQKVNYGLCLKKFNESSWLLTLVIGILFGVIGIIAFFTQGETVIRVTGILFIGYGFIEATNVILLRKRSEYFLS